MCVPRSKSCTILYRWSGGALVIPVIDECNLHGDENSHLPLTLEELAPEDWDQSEYFTCWIYFYKKKKSIYIYKIQNENPSGVSSGG